MCVYIITHCFQGQVALKHKLSYLSKNLALGVGQVHSLHPDICNAMLVMFLGFLCLETDTYKHNYI